jgi:hypothetical protein
MRVFTCDHCGQVVFFDNDLCLRCQSPLGYVPRDGDIVALTEVDKGRFVDLTGATRTWERCANRALTGCNWLVPHGSGVLCASCVLTRTRPADSDESGMAELVKAEVAKRRLLFQLGQLGLDVVKRDEGLGVGLAFDLLSSADAKVITGHDNGLITLDLAEADSEHRQKLRHQLGEPYRTLLGHFRHEIGHYFWPILVSDPDVLDTCRALFGDDRASYAEAVDAHYAKGDESSTSWSNAYISQYATMHPYEDWAECFAHYLHIHDTLQTAVAFDLGPTGTEAVGFGEMIDRWLLLTRGLNEVNRSMGRGDLYPFVIAPAVIRKLAFVDHVLRQAGARSLEGLTQLP